MKKRIILIITIGIIIFLSLILYINYTKINKENQKRYNEIKEKVQKEVEWNVKAMYPGCLIDRNLSGEHLQGNTYHDSSFLIKNGYIKKEDLLDADKKSFCDITVRIYVYFENPLDQQRNCKTNYKIVLKCKHYTDKI